MNFDTLYIKRTIINFVLLVEYRFYNNKTLRYIDIALTRIDLLKEVFRVYKSLDIITSKSYFNFLKFYSINYLYKTIRFLSLLDRYTT